MNTKFFFLVAFMLLSVCAFAQSESTLKGDVNNDGTVDVADINAVIEIMKNGGGTVEESSYYWYIGQIDPSTIDEISPIVTDNSSPGWRKIGNTLPNYSASNMLWNGENNHITFAGRDYYYIALPSNSIKIYSDLGDSVMDVFSEPTTKMINGVTYYFYVYKSNNKAFAFGYNIY